MPEFPGYTGPASSQCWLIKVKAVTHRENPIMQTCIGPSKEHVSMAGIPTEASIYGMIEKAMLGRLQNVYCASLGGGKFMAVLQFKTEGMLIVPCSMKTVAGICSRYTDNLILRAADVTIKEQRTLVLAARETPLSAIHLRNLHELSRIPGVRVIPPMMTFYHMPESIDDMVYHITAKLLEPFGVEAKKYCRWKGF